MTSEDCSEVGQSPCPCGKGEIVVEYCTPDHPWARGGSYRQSLNCDDCQQAYEFFGRDPSKKSRLVRSQDAERIRVAEKAWHETLRTIESSQTFKALSAALKQTLAEQRSAAGAYRLLVAGKLTSDSLWQYRRRGYTLSPLKAAEALRFFGKNDPDFEALIAQEDELSERMREVPPAVKSGNRGLEE